MRRSTKRILTTHTGSLPRPADLAALLQGGGHPEAAADRDERVGGAVREAVRKQAAAGIDVVSGPLPRNPNGKIDRKLLATAWVERAAAGAAEA